MKRVLLPVGLSLIAGLATVLFAMQTGQVEVKVMDADHRVDIRIDGKLFTSYQFGPDYKQKPVFYPVLTPSGKMVNRDLPFINKGFKIDDHPHHQSVYFGYGDVNGYDFWSTGHGERIVHRAIVNTQGGPEGSLAIVLDWLTPEGEALVREYRRVTFGGEGNLRWMDHDIRLEALNKRLEFADTKEGIFAFRLADELREDKGTGRYENAFGWETEQGVWGKRAPWVALRGILEGEPVTVAIFDHPSTVNYPSYWHARAYGLFAVNPFGKKDFVKGSEPMNLSIRAGESFHFKYRILLYSGTIPKKDLDEAYQAFIN